jgi:thiol-disulfide isomerase/thioredoxin
MTRARKLARGVLATGLILAAAVVGFALGTARRRPPANRVAPLARTAPAAPAARTSTVRHPIPDTLPRIAFRDRRGRLRRLSDWRGHPLLVNFWAPWCSPCRAEIPLLEQLSRARPQGVQVIGVAVNTRPAVLRYAERAGIRYPLLIGLGPGLRAIRALGMVAVFPFSVFVDAHGRIVTFKIGRLHAAQARLILDRIGALDRGQIDLATARRQISAGIRRLALHRSPPATG